MSAHTLDVVILAAGRGERLSNSGITAPYLKPLLPVNGRPLVRNAVQLANSITTVQPPIVVVAPENALTVSQVLNGLSASLIVQRYASGPGNALLLALRLVTAHNVLVLMADNVLTEADVVRVAATPTTDAVVGVRQMPKTDAERFTYLDSDQRWVEKTTPMTQDANVTCWIGPLRLPSRETRTVLDQGDGSALGPPLLNNFMPDRLTQVQVDTFDVGTPDMWEIK